MKTFLKTKPSGGHSEGVLKIVNGYLLLINLRMFIGNYCERK